jgi:hypothetical protein
MSGKKLHKILLDLQKEVAGDMLENTVEVNGKKFLMRLLTEAETAYSFSMVDATNNISIAMSTRLANLSVGIRSIDGVTIEEMFKPVYENLDDEEKEEFVGDTFSTIYAKLFHDWLKIQSPYFISELNDHWMELERRRIDAKAEVKNSLGEISEKAEKKS